MSMYRDHLIRVLLDATSLVLDVLKNKRTIYEFVEEYNNFYYQEALDGHEANDAQKDILHEFKNAIVFHEKVQTEVVNIVFLGNGEDMKRYAQSGKITPLMARKRLGELCKRYGAEQILNALIV